MFIFIAVIFFTSKMAGNSEIIAILSSGVSYRRFLFPYFVSSLILAIFSYLLINWVIPPANEERLAFEEKYIRNRFVNREHDIHRQILPGQFIYMSSYNTNYDLGYKFALEQIEDGKLKSKVIAESVEWDTATNKWKMSNCYIRTFSDSTEKVKYYRKLDTTLNMLPSDFTRRDNVVEAMNYKQLNEFIESETRKGSDNVVLWKIEKHKRFAYSFSTFILTLIGVTLSSRKKRGGIGINIGVGILLAFTYIMFMEVSNVMATNAHMPPVIAVWIPNIIFRSGLRECRLILIYVCLQSGRIGSF
jgi:lipopolysaccharide export system permease protein